MKKIIILSTIVFASVGSALFSMNVPLNKQGYASFMLTRPYLGFAKSHEFNIVEVACNMYGQSPVPVIKKALVRFISTKSKSPEAVTVDDIVLSRKGELVKKLQLRDDELVNIGLTSGNPLIVEIKNRM